MREMAPRPRSTVHNSRVPSAPNRLPSRVLPSGENSRCPNVPSFGGASDDPIIKLDYSSGLVDVPQLGEKKDKGTIVFKALIQPELIPGRKVFVDWLLDRGEFVCDSVKHKGSNYDNEFYSVVQAFLP